MEGLYSTHLLESRMEVCTTTYNRNIFLLRDKLLRRDFICLGKPTQISRTQFTMKEMGTIICKAFRRL